MDRVDLAAGPGDQGNRDRGRVVAIRQGFTPESKTKVVLDVSTGAQAPVETCRKPAASTNRLSPATSPSHERVATIDSLQ
jgi:hypothetical protein